MLHFIAKEFPVSDGVGANSGVSSPSPFAGLSDTSDSEHEEREKKKEQTLKQKKHQPLASWAAFDPRVGHKFSGRTNDDQADNDTDLSFMLSKVAGFFGRSFLLRSIGGKTLMKWCDKIVRRYERGDSIYG